MKRIKAIQEAIASLEIEGHKFTDEELALFKKVASGELSYEDVINLANEKLELWRKKNPDCFAEEN